MKNFEELQEFIRSNPNWKDILKSFPYNLKSVTECPYHKGWWLLVYNLFQSDLSNPIVKQCRGTVVDEDGNIICAPYIKFFNYGETYADSIDWKSAVTREKIDGQLIKMFRYVGQSYWITNGGWNPEYLDLSDDAPFKDGKELLNYAIGNVAWCDTVPDGWTLMFELTSPYNQIICEYSEPKLWFHGCRNAEGEEISPEKAKDMFGLTYDIPEIIPGDSIEELLSLLATWNGMEQEGIVVCDKNWHRIKVKCEDYLKHKFERCLNSPKMIWRLWADGEWDDITGEAKDKIVIFNDEVKSYINHFEYIYVDVKNIRQKFLVDDEKLSRKYFAEYIKGQFTGYELSYRFLAYDRTLEDFNDLLLRQMQSSWKKFKEIKERCVVEARS